MAENPAFHYWVYLTVFLFFKMFTNSLLQGSARFRGNSFHYPEDQKKFAKGEATDDYKDFEMRATNCWRNDLENIPMFIILGLAFVLMGGSEKMSMIYFGIFAFARASHTLCLMKSLQPWRGMAFGIGLFSTFAVGLHAVYLTL